MEVLSDIEARLQSKEIAAVIASANVDVGIEQVADVCIGTDQCAVMSVAADINIGVEQVADIDVGVDQ